METVISEYEDRTDGIYLFANLGALGFYEKLEFSYGREYRCVLREKPAPAGELFRPVAHEEKPRFFSAVRSAAVNSRFEQVNRYGLTGFYTTDMGSVYYCGELDCFTVLEQAGGTLTLQSIICRRHIGLGEILPRLGSNYETLLLGFSPLA